jgi:hypothetical protein
VEEEVIQVQHHHLEHMVKVEVEEVEKVLLVVLTLLQDQLVLLTQEVEVAEEMVQ